MYFLFMAFFCEVLFLYFGVVAPDKTNDNAAIPLCVDLKKFIDDLPFGMYVVGDAAYTLTEHLLTPFTGTQKLNPNNNTFNFHLSQLRIRIEMVFGRFCQEILYFEQKIRWKIDQNLENNNGLCKVT